MQVYEPTTITKQYLKDLSHHDEMMKSGYRIAFYNIGKQLTRYTREIIKKGPKTGRLYYIAGRKKRHRASAAGEAPANLTGRLRKGVNFNVSGWDQMQFGDTVFYGKFLEEGTRKMKPRPHLSKSVDYNEPYAEQQLALEPLRAIHR